MFKKENLRKNFLRVKQIADQNLGRVEKTEVLSDDLQNSEKRVELVKQVCSNTVKKVSTSLIGAGAADPEKRLKKMPEAGLGHSMTESANIVPPESIMGQMFEMCGSCESSLASKHLQYELDVEKTVIEPLQEILDVEIPQIAKYKKQLSKVTLDMDSAKSRWNSAVKQAQVPGVNMTTASNKADSVKDEFEEASNRVEQAKDVYTTGMFNFISKEAEHCQTLVSLLEAQANYHRQALEVIEAVIPKMKETLSCNPTKPVYGVSLEEHLRVANRDIAVVLESCICYLLECGLEEEGLLRIAGMASKVKKLKASFDAGIVFDELGELDPHTVAGALKQYLRELPEPLLTFALFQDFVAAASKPVDQRLQALWMVVDRLPKPNYDNFRYLIKFLAKVNERCDVNKMNPANIAIVIGPNLIWSEGDNGPNMMNTGMLSLITELIVQHADWFFPGAQDFHATLRGHAPEHQMIDRTQIVTKRDKQANLVQDKQGSSGQDKHPPPKPARPQDPHINKLATSGPGSKTEKTNHAGSSKSAPEPSSSTSLQCSSPDTISSSSESSSLSDVTPMMRQYETADTLERLDGTNGYHTAKADLGIASQAHSSIGFTNTNKLTNPPVLRFNPNDRDKYRNNGERKLKRVSDPAPQPQSPSTPTSQSVHSDVYSTVFALQSLGDGTWPAYLNKVRSMWDDQLQQPKASSMRDRSIVGNDYGKGHTRSSQEVNFQQTGTGGTITTPGKSENQSDHPNVVRTGSNQSVSSQGTPQSSPTNQDSAQTTPPRVSRSPSGSPATSTNNLQGTPIVERYLHKPRIPPPLCSYKVEVESLACDDDSCHAIGSEELHLRKPAPRKPAPPPPPERPYSVAVSASVKTNQQASQFQTWPRQAVSPQFEPGNDIHHSDKQKTLPGDRPIPPERHSSHSGSGSDRPKIPPPVVPPGHHRSASTGAPVTVPGNSLQQAEYDNPGIGSPYLQVEGHVDSQYNNTLPTPPDKYSSLNRHSIARPPRPMPPPPPPPESPEVVEETHL